MEISVSVQLVEAKAEIEFLRQRVLILSQIGNEYRDQVEKLTESVRELQGMLTEANNRTAEAESRLSNHAASFYDDTEDLTK